MSNENSSAGIALVTGAATGIGAACCRRLADQGFRIGVHYNRSDGPARELLEMLPNAFLVQADLSTEAGVDAIYKQVKAETLPLNVLVNNAGMTIDNPLVRAKLTDFDQVVGLNMRGTWYLTKRLTRIMMRQKYGRVITISSIVGHTGNAFQSVYGMTKAALENLTRTLATELAPYGLLVNAIAPGFIETAMTAKLDDEFKDGFLARIPLGRFGSPAEIAEVVAFLATAASYVTGTTIHVNGGLYGG